MKPSPKNLALFVMISLIMVVLFRTTDQTKSSSISVSYSDFLNMVESESITQVTIQGDSISGIS
ncbi:MAG: ATP-dependent metallopeptidase FtsH/Yme1/Tma family protein, partial [Deltaproteobacteria bacterium]|nr:ATP-dependent metallopeptidase FtsH/Yme1/Tma family protein [Deltaproteobacteria bacterium]